MSVEGSDEHRVCFCYFLGPLRLPHIIKRSFHPTSDRQLRKLLSHIRYLSTITILKMNPYPSPYTTYTSSQSLKETPCPNIPRPTPIKSSNTFRTYEQ